MKIADAIFLYRLFLIGLKRHEPDTLMPKLLPNKILTFRGHLTFRLVLRYPIF